MGPKSNRSPTTGAGPSAWVSGSRWWWLTTAASAGSSGRSRTQGDLRRPARHGSGPAVARGAASVGAIVAALVAAIDAVGEEADVIGYSLGARLAWALTATGRPLLALTGRHTRLINPL